MRRVAILMTTLALTLSGLMVSPAHADTAGIDWTKRTGIAGLWDAVAYGNGKFVAVSETPESWGASGGKYGAEKWVEEGNESWPTSDSVALFCVSISEEGQKKFNWTFQQQIESSDACSRAFVDGLK